jgi:HEAT repeat protein
MNFLQSLWSQAHLAPAFQAIIICVLILAALAALACAMLVAHHGFTSIRRRRRGDQVERAALFLAPHIAAGDTLGAAVADSRGRHGAWATSIVLREARLRATPERAALLSSTLFEMGEVARLTKLARSSRAWRRSQAVRELGQCGGSEALAVLQEATRDPSAEVRRAAREGLLGDGRPTSVRAGIRAYLEDGRIGSASKRSFYAQLAATAGDALRDLLRGGTLSPDEEKLALEAMGDARNPDVLPMARERLTAPDPELRATAARVVGKLADQESSAVLRRLLDDEEWYVRAAAAKAFASLAQDDSSQRRLAGLLEDEVWWVRANAAHALAQHGDEGMDTLLAAIDGQDNYSRDAALAALGLVIVTPGARQRLQDRLHGATQSTHAGPLHRLLEAVPAEMRA